MKTFRWLESSFPSQILSNIHHYTNAELDDMHFIYGATQGNGAAAQRMYMERFLGRNLPYCRTFERLHWELCTSGSFYASRRDTGTGRYCRIPAVEEELLRSVKDGPSKSSKVFGHAQPLTSRSISLRSHIHQIRVGKLRIGVTMHVAQNPCGE